MKKSFLKAIFIGFLILFATNIIIILLKPLMPWVMDEVWDSIGVSFGMAYIITYNLNYKEGNTSVKAQRIINYLYSLIVVFLIYFGLSFVL